MPPGSSLLARPQTSRRPGGHLPPPCDIRPLSCGRRLAPRIVRLPSGSCPTTNPDRRRGFATRVLSVDRETMNAPGTQSASLLPPDEKGSRIPFRCVAADTSPRQHEPGRRHDRLVRRCTPLSCFVGVYSVRSGFPDESHRVVLIAWLFGPIRRSNRLAWHSNAHDFIAACGSVAR